MHIALKHKRISASGKIKWLLIVRLSFEYYKFLESRKPNMFWVVEQSRYSWTMSVAFFYTTQIIYKLKSMWFLIFWMNVHDIGFFWRFQWTTTMSDPSKTWVLISLVHQEILMHPGLIAKRISGSSLAKKNITHGTITKKSLLTAGSLAISGHTFARQLTIRWRSRNLPTS